MIWRKLKRRKEISPVRNRHSIKCVLARLHSSKQLHCIRKYCTDKSTRFLDNLRIAKKKNIYKKVFSAGHQTLQKNLCPSTTNETGEMITKALSKWFTHSPSCGTFDYMYDETRLYILWIVLINGNWLTCIMWRMTHDKILTSKFRYLFPQQPMKWASEIFNWAQTNSISAGDWVLHLPKTNQTSSTHMSSRAPATTWHYSTRASPTNSII